MGLLTAILDEENQNVPSGDSISDSVVSTVCEIGVAKKVEPEMPKESQATEVSDISEVDSLKLNGDHSEVKLSDSGLDHSGVSTEFQNEVAKSNLTAVESNKDIADQIGDISLGTAVSAKDEVESVIKPISVEETPQIELKSNKVSKADSESQPIDTVNEKQAYSDIEHLQKLNGDLLPKDLEEIVKVTKTEDGNTVNKVELLVQKKAKILTSEQIIKDNQKMTKTKDTKLKKSKKKESKSKSRGEITPGKEGVRSKSSKSSPEKGVKKEKKASSLVSTPKQKSTSSSKQSSSSMKKSKGSSSPTKSKSSSSKSKGTSSTEKVKPVLRSVSSPPKASSSPIKTDSIDSSKVSDSSLKKENNTLPAEKPRGRSTSRSVILKRTTKTEKLRLAMIKNTLEASQNQVGPAYSHSPSARRIRSCSPQKTSRVTSPDKRTGSPLKTKSTTARSRKDQLYDQMEYDENERLSPLSPNARKRYGINARNETYRPGGGNVRIFSEKMDFKNVSSRIDSRSKSPRKSPPSSTQSPARQIAGAEHSSPSPSSRNVRSKIGSLDNARHTPGGGNVKIINKKEKYDAVQSRVGSKDNITHRPGGGNIRIENKRLSYLESAKPKVGSLDKVDHKPGGGDKKILDDKLEWTVQPKVGSKINITHKPGGGDKKIEDQKLEWKAGSKVGSKDNLKHVPGGGEIKIPSQNVLGKEVDSNVGCISDEDHQAVGGIASSPPPPSSSLPQVESQVLKFKENAEPRTNTGINKS
ncbi:titin-like [Octopus vulgaris]|uniref:Microtubule-associated protein n=1 Tax=Octopus vulgaris TaxID=6645 RepID=A0AA36F2P5_OCTVU|nr:titin-like [Octopus vulgaris]